MTTINLRSAPLSDQQASSRVRWTDKTAEVALAFFWGLAEAAAFFVVPDVLISLAAMLHPARVWRHVMAATAGALIGGALLYAWSARNPLQAQAAVTHVPFVRTKMLEDVHASYQAHGMRAILIGPLTGTPYKIYAVEAPDFISLGAFLAITIPARLERFLFVWAVFGLAGSVLRSRFRISVRQFAIAHACFWGLFYAFYWGRIVLH